MKQIIRLAISTMAIVLLWNCSKNNENIAARTDLVITAYTENPDDTKTTLIDGGTGVYWEPGDEIKVFYKDGTGRFASKNTETAKVASFSGSINTVIGSDEGFAGGEKMWGLYPYRDDATYDGSAVTTIIPNVQTGKAGSFAKNMNISLAKSSNLALSFYNVCGGIRFSVTRNDIKNVTFEGKNNEDLAGKIKITFEQGVPAIKGLTDGQKKITLNAPNNGTFQTGKWYYIIAAPGTLKNGFKLTLDTDSTYAELIRDGEQTIKRGIFGSLQNADAGLEFHTKDGYCCVTVKQKGTLHDILDTVSIGKKNIKNLKIIGVLNDVDFLDIYHEMPALRHLDISDVNITTLPNQSFYQSKNVRSIILPKTLTVIGAKCFAWSVIESVEMSNTMVNEISSEAFSSSSLKEISLPQSLITIGDIAFRSTHSLNSISLPEKLEYIGESAFKNSHLSVISVPKHSQLKTIGNMAFRQSDITSMTIPSSVDSLGAAVFYDCKNLRECIIEGGNTILSLNMLDDRSWSDRYLGFFENCEALESIVIPGNIDVIGKECFMGCTSLSSVDMTQAYSLSKIEKNAFKNCTSLQKVDFGGGSSLSFIGDNAFSGCSSLLDFTLPKSVKDLGESAFYGCSGMKFFTFEKGCGVKRLNSECGYNPYHGLFGNCSSLTEISIADSINYIDRNCFSGCSSLKKVTFAPKASSITIAGGERRYVSDPFYGAFYDCPSLSDLIFDFGNAEVTIGDYAFYQCPVLARINMSTCTNVKSIGEEAFYSSGKIYLFKIGTVIPPALGRSAFGGYLPYAVLKVPAESVDAYKAASGWKSFPEISALDD